MRIFDEKAVLDQLPMGLSRAVKMELFADVLDLRCSVYKYMRLVQV